MISFLLSTDRKLRLPIDVGNHCILDTLARVDERPKAPYGYLLTAPPKEETLSDRQVGSTERTVKS